MALRYVGKAFFVAPLLFAPTTDLLTGDLSASAGSTHEALLRKKMFLA